MKYIKKLLIVLFAVFIAGFIYVLVNLNGITTYNKEDYARLADSVDFLPDIDYFDSASDIDFFRFKKSFSGFSSESYTLTAEYNSDTYFSERELLNEKYIFETGNVTDCTGNELSSEFTCYGYKFYLLDAKAYDMLYPKEIVLIGCSDSEHKITYIYFMDKDLDVITSFESFLMNYCGWR